MSGTTGRDGAIMIEDILDDLDQTGMGTENVSPLLSALVRMRRPRTVLEIGAGLSTVHLLLALRDVVREREADLRVVTGEVADEERASVLVPHRALDQELPRVVVVDDFSVVPSTAPAVIEAAKRFGMDDMLSFINRDFFEIPDAEFAAYGAFDLVWLDAGTPLDDLRFVTRLWPLLNREHGFMVLHEPYLTVPAVVEDGAGRRRRALRSVATPLLNAVRRQCAAAGADADFEVLTIPELHKSRQGGALVIHKLPSRPDPPYPDHASEVAALAALWGEDGPLPPEPRLR